MNTQTRARFVPPASQTVDGTGKEYAKPLGVPTLAVIQRTYSTSITLPEIKPISGDRASRRDANVANRELQKGALAAAKAGVAIQAMRAVSTYMVAQADKGQGEIMDIYDNTPRHPEMNEFMGQVVTQALQSMATAMLAGNELHNKRQLENL